MVKLHELEATVQKHTSAALHSEKKKLDDLEARSKALEGKAKKILNLLILVSNVFFYCLYKR